MPRSPRRTAGKAGIPYFVRKGVPTYVVDQAGRGRSGFDESVIHEGEAQMVGRRFKGGADMIPGFGRITDDGAWTNWFGHLVPADSTILTGKLIPHGDPGDPNPHPDATARRAAVSDRRRGFDDRRRVRARSAPRRAVRPETYALEYYKQLVPNAEVTLPGSICDTCDPKEIAPANTWTPQNLATLVERLGGAIVATHSQSGIMGHHMARILKERGHLGSAEGTVTLEGSCSLPNSGLNAADFDTFRTSR